MHLEAVRFARDGFSIVLIGHKDHDEVIGTLGEVPGPQLPGGNRGRCGQPGSPRSAARPLTSPRPRSAWTRRTDLVNRLKQRFPLIEGPQSQDICYATETPPDGGESDIGIMWTCCWWWARQNSFELQAAG